MVEPTAIVATSAEAETAEDAFMRRVRRRAGSRAVSVVRAARVFGRFLAMVSLP